MLYRTTASITTDSSGDATVFLGGNVHGWILQVKYLPGSIATGADLVVTGETSGTPILTVTNAGTSDAWYYPRAVVNEVADASADTNRVRIPIFDERIKVVVAQGGSAAAGSIELIYVDDVDG